MPLDFDQCFRACQARDARFDGAFFMAVKTTGIYCRPVCPARTPKRENVVFFRTAVEAQAAGYRPCLRCRPEAAPGTPAWQGVSATVERALRLIDQGLLDRMGVEELAAKLGVSARQLRRLFSRHLGVSPTAMARTRRLHLARKLIQETDLPLGQVALSVGFGSLRRFGEAFKEVFKRPPSLFRKEARSQPRAGPELKLSYRPPYAWPTVLGHLEARLVPGLEEMGRGVFRRAVRLGEEAGVVEVEPEPGQDLIRLRVSRGLSPHLPEIRGRVERMFDLQAAPEVIGAHLARDPLLAPARDGLAGLRLLAGWEPFEVAARIIVGQLISVKAAATLLGRLVGRAGERLPRPEGTLTHCFPTPAGLAEADLRGLGLTGQKILGLQGLARVVVQGGLELSAAGSLAETLSLLTALPGIGPWSAQMIALRALGQPDAFPASDLGLLRAASKGLGRKITAPELEARAEAWRPWRGYGAACLWAMDHQSLERIKDERA